MRSMLAAYSLKLCAAQIVDNVKVNEIKKLIKNVFMFLCLFLEGSLKPVEVSGARNVHKITRTYSIYSSHSRLKLSA